MIPDDIIDKIKFNAKKFGFKNVSEYLSVTFMSLLKTGVDVSLVKDVLGELPTPQQQPAPSPSVDDPQLDQFGEPQVPLFNRPPDSDERNFTTPKMKVVFHKSLFYIDTHSNKLGHLCCILYTSPSPRD